MRPRRRQWMAHMAAERDKSWLASDGQSRVCRPLAAGSRARHARAPDQSRGLRRRAGGPWRLPGALADWPAHSDAGDEVDALAQGGRRIVAWCRPSRRRARRAPGAIGLFDRVFVLDPFYDRAPCCTPPGTTRYQGRARRRLAEQAGWLVRLGAAVNAGTAMLAPEHLPGSWNPRPAGASRGTKDPRQVGAWAMRTSLVLLYWADRLDAWRVRRPPGRAAAMRGDPRGAGCALDARSRLTASCRGSERGAASARRAPRRVIASSGARCAGLRVRRGRRCLEDLATCAPRDARSRRAVGVWRLMLGEGVGAGAGDAHPSGLERSGSRAGAARCRGGGCGAGRVSVARFAGRRDDGWLHDSVVVSPA